MTNNNEDPTPTDETLFTHPPLTPSNPLHRSLSSLDLSLRCTICYNLLNVPVSLYPCLHTFCSLCVRKNLKRQYVGMKRKAECPTCNVNLLSGNGGGYEKNILPNRQLESVVDLYRGKVRGELRNSLVRLDVLERKEQERQQEDGGHQEEEEQKIAAVSSSKRARRSTANYKREYSSDQEDGNDNDEGDGTMTLNATNDDSSTSPPPPAVTAASSFKNSTNNPQQQQRKRKPPISYHNLKRPKLIQLLKSENLPTNGSDIELQHRHSEYILLYNSQCDSSHPMSERDVIATIMKEEKGRKREKVEAMKSGANKHEGYMKKLAESVKCRNNNEDATGNTTVVVTTGSKRLDGEMKNNFKEMIEKVKARKRGDDTTTSSSSSTSFGNDVPSCIAAAAAATADAVENGNNAASSKPRTKRSDTTAASVSAAVSANNHIASTAATVVVGAPTMKAATSSSIRTTTTAAASSTATTTRQKSITTNFPKSKTTTSTPSKSRTTLKKQATLSTTKPSSTTKTKSCGVWKCPICTFENHKYITATAICEMCNTPRPEKENNGGENEVIAIDC